MFKLKLSNKNIIQINSYNELADWCYQKLVKGDVVAIEGKLNSRMEIIIKSCQRFSRY